MADAESAYNTILGKLKTKMDAARPLVPIAWPNIQFDPADDYTPGTHQGWARVALVGGDAEIASAGGTGSRRWRHYGVVVVQVFTPLGKGAAMALAIADDVATAFRGVTASGVVLRAPTVRPIGTDAEGAFWQCNIETPYRYDQTA